MAPKPTAFHLIDEPQPFYQNFSPLPDHPAAKLMRGDDDRIYEQGWQYEFDGGMFLFFNGQLWPMQIVRKLVSMNDGTREADVWETIPHDDPVAQAIEVQRGGRGSIRLIHEPDTTWGGH